MPTAQDTQDRDDFPEIEFVWHSAKAASNLKKHGVSFPEASTIFGDKKHVVVPDREHSWDEVRSLAIGMSDQRRLIIMCFTERDDRVRIISAVWRNAGKGGSMKAQMSNDEKRLRAQFNFSKAERGRFYERYKKGHTITLLSEDAEIDDPLDSAQHDSQLIEIAGKHLLISRLVAAGFEVAEPLRDKGIDLIVYRDDEKFKAWPIQMKASTQESFSLDRRYEGIPDLLIAYGGTWMPQNRVRCIC